MRFCYTSNKPISRLPLAFSCLLNSFLPLLFRFPSSVFKYLFFFIILFCTNSVYCCKQLSFWYPFSIQCTLPRFLFLHVMLFTPTNVAPLLWVYKCVFLLKPLCQQFHHTVLLQVGIFGEMDITKKKWCSSAALQRRCAKQLMKNIVKLVIKLNWFSCLSCLKSHTQYRDMHLIFKTGEHAAYVTIKLLWCTVHNFGVM